jgi:hypothetical protein
MLYYYYYADAELLRCYRGRQLAACSSSSIINKMKNKKLAGVPGNPSLEVPTAHTQYCPCETLLLKQLASIVIAACSRAHAHVLIANYLA